ncbi:hypothetical protein GDO81_025196 [Engystomops pustulosus]|uniref:Uncharacterized protein n=1 Tax=Engystomops pustulosus TaxID=76066 RepID=A0AAV6ZAE2_ENGPU|nr:hypothetical protein GDO81_025196 [Engystomops pustulosus]
MSPRPVRVISQENPTEYWMGLSIGGNCLKAHNPSGHFGYCNVPGYHPLDCPLCDDLISRGNTISIYSLLADTDLYHILFSVHIQSCIHVVQT